MIAERHFKNEDSIKQKIVDGHRQGVCDKDGRTDFILDASGRRGAIAKRRPLLPGSVVKTYVLRNGEMVLKNG